MSTNFVASGQKTVTTAGTAVQLSTTSNIGEFIIKANNGNTGLMFIGNDGAGDVTSANGFELSAGRSVPFIGNLSSIWVDSAVSGEKVNWIKIAPTPR